MRTLAEFTEALKAGRRERGLDDSGIMEEDPAEMRDSSGAMRYGVVFMGRRPRPRNEKPEEGSNG